MFRLTISALLLFITPFLILCCLTGTGADPLFTDCSNDTGNYTVGGPFEDNLKVVLQALPLNASSTGFATTSVGEAPNKVYGQALCRGDVNSTLCHSCIENASLQILKDCRSKDAIIWYELCQVYYSFQNLSLSYAYTGKYPEWDSNEKIISDPIRFNKLVVFLMNNLSDEAAFNPSKGMFATGEIKFSRKETIYGLVQCTRNISQQYCHNCLISALGDLNACCDQRQGGIILSRTCNLRFELSPFYNASSYLLTYQYPKGNKWEIWMIILVASIPTAVLTIIVWSGVVYLRRKGRRQQDEAKSQTALLQELASPEGVTMTQEGDLVGSEELTLMDLTTIKAATDDFSAVNKLGQGGFGTVFKGVLTDGKEIAVKRLSRKSWQGLEEFKNEVKLIAKLQHRNLVRLLGCGIEGDEKLLIYEFMPHKSLDLFIFDSERRLELDWKTCYNIIVGIARGLLYLHEDSRLKIIHRDLKPSNVLLDNEMNAKISDFGMARIFGENQNIANTKRVVGTYGYMAPEYAMGGLFSAKSDVFSFGVILLEVVSGKKNSGFYLTERAQSLLAYAWHLWNEGKQLEFADNFLLETGPTSELEKCIHIGLLCVQEDPEDRPTMSSVVVLLGNEPVSLPQPKQPAFSVGRVIPIDCSSTTDPSSNQITDSIVSPR